MRERILRQADARAEEHSRHRRPPRQREIHRDHERDFQIRKIGDETRHVDLKQDRGQGDAQHGDPVEFGDAGFARSRENRPDLWSWMRKRGGRMEASSGPAWLGDARPGDAEPGDTKLGGAWL